MPVPTIFLIDNQNEIVQMKDEPYDSEDRLQKFLADFPSVLAGDQISGSEPLRWLLIKREAGIPDDANGSERFSLDHLFVDQNGVPTLVEVKRSTDTHIRREVVGQMLDYAANATRYWPISTLQDWFEQTCAADGAEATIRLSEFLGDGDPGESDAIVTRFWENIESNLSAGRVRLIFAADEIPRELRRIIEFLDEQMKAAEVLGIEIRQYVGANVRTLVPTVVRSLKRIEEPAERHAPVQWNRELFLKALLERRGPEAVAVTTKVLDWAVAKGVPITWGRGRRDGSCNLGLSLGGPNFYPFVLWTYGRIQIGYQTLQQQSVPQECIEELEAGLKGIPGTPDIPNMLNRYPTFEMQVLREQSRMDEFLAVLGRFFERALSAQHAEVCASSVTPHDDVP